VRTSTRRTLLWGFASAGALAAVVAAFALGTDDGGGDNERSGAVTASDPAPRLPDDVGEGCGTAALTDADDLDASRLVARCTADFPRPQPLAETAHLRVALTQRGEAAAPVLLADSMGEFAAEGLDVELVDQPVVDAFAGLAAGEVDAVVGPVDSSFFDAVKGGTRARWVLGGTLSAGPGDDDVPQAGLWLRSDLMQGEGRWHELAGMRVGLDAGWRSASVYPVATAAAQRGLSLNDVDLVATAGDDAVDRLLGGELAAAWVDQPAWARVAEADGFALAVTLPASEPIDGTMLSGRMLGAERDVGVAYARAVIRTIDTYLSGDYHDNAEVMGALAETTGADADELTATPSLLFDWEIRSGTTSRLQDAMIGIGAVGYELPLPERKLVDRTLAVDALGLRAR
jgi:NitT/TauT family transport system substrate-binding protein